MKKLIAVLIMTMCVFPAVFAREGLQISGEMKTGLFWYNLQRDGQEPDSQAFIHNSEDVNWLLARQSLAGLSTNMGRFRLNFHYSFNENIGVKFRFQSTQWQANADNMLFWDYAFAYGYFLNNNLKISAGRMGDSPWGAGGPELWRELDTTLGIRFEYIPQNIPFIRPGSLNVGFVLNNFDGGAENIVDPQWDSGDSSILDVLTETVIGISYTHDLFHLRFAYRLDGLWDGPAFERLVYRVEERILQRFIPGFQIWANGYFEGLNPRGLTIEGVPATSNVSAVNWLYVQYEPQLFIAQLRLGWVIDQGFERFLIRPGFYFRLFNNLLQIGAAFEYAVETSELKLFDNTPYMYWYIEPQIRLNLLPNSYIALVYRFHSDYMFGSQETRTHWLNLRVVFTF